MTLLLLCYNVTAYPSPSHTVNYAYRALCMCAAPVNYKLSLASAYKLVCTVSLCCTCPLGPRSVNYIATMSKLSDGALEICRSFDKDGDGFISKNELKEALGDSTSDREIDELLKSADTNNDGKVNYKGYFSQYCGVDHTDYIIL